MTTKICCSLLALVTTGMLSVAAQAAINRPPGQEQGQSYEECTVECREFVDAEGCREFRRANLICTEKKKSTWPIFTAQVLAEMEC
jgi:hypothetical protein